MDTDSKKAIDRLVNAATCYDATDGETSSVAGDTNTDIFSFMNCVMHVRTAPAGIESQYLQLHANNASKFSDNALLDSLDFNVFSLELCAEAEGDGEEERLPNPDLTITAFEILRRHGFDQSLGVSQRALMRFVCTLRLNYFDSVPYHNFRHALNVMQTMHVMLTMNDKIVQRTLGLTETHCFAMLIACIGHDLGHVGLNNTFLADTNSPLALRYNDKAILEQHHCAMTFAAASAAAGGDSSLDIFAPFSAPREGDAAAYARIKRFHDVRKLITTMILSTEVAQHNAYVKEVNCIADEVDKIDTSSRNSNGVSQFFSENPDKQLSVMCALVEACDIGNEIRPFEVASRWAPVVLLEFGRQGDRMRALGMAVPKMFDRSQMNMAADQVGFLRFMCIPLYQSLARVLPALQPCVETIQSSVAAWEAKKGDADMNAKTMQLLDEAEAATPDRSTKRRRQRND